MPLTPEGQRARYLRGRTCGNCPNPATEMLPWHGSKIAICHRCAGALRKIANRTASAKPAETRGE